MWACTYRIAGFCHEDFNVASHGIRNIKIRYIFYLVTFYHVTFYHVRFCNCLVLSILQYFAKKQVGSLPNPEGALSNNARVYTKFHCFDNWHLLELRART